MENISIVEIAKEKLLVISSVQSIWNNIKFTPNLVSDRRQIEENVNELYLSMGISTPKNIIWTTSPQDALDQIKVIVKNKRNKLKVKSGFIKEYLFDVFSNTNLVPFYDAYYNYMNLKDVGGSNFNIISKLIAIQKEVKWFCLYSDSIFLSENPVVIRHEKMYNNDLLHCLDAPALEYADGYTQWATYGKFLK